MDKPVQRVAFTFFGRQNVVRRPANRTSTTDTPVLAAFDPDNAVVWANEVLAATVARNRDTRRVLRDEDTETLAHEFARVLQYRDIFQEYDSYNDRVAALRKRRSRMIMRSTSESYANQKLFEERQAEEVVQRIRMEILDSFDRGQRGAGIGIRNIATRAEESAASIVRGLRADYLSSARGEFARLHSGLYASADMVKHGAMEPPCTKGKVLEIREIRWLFPTSLSPTLADLIDEITGFGIDIVIAAAAVD